MPDETMQVEEQQAEPALTGAEKMTALISGRGPAATIQVGNDTLQIGEGPGMITTEIAAILAKREKETRAFQASADTAKAEAARVQKQPAPALSTPPQQIPQSPGTGELQGFSTTPTTQQVPQGSPAPAQDHEPAASVNIPKLSIDMGAVGVMDNAIGAEGGLTKVFTALLAGMDSRDAAIAAAFEDTHRAGLDRANRLLKMNQGLQASVAPAIAAETGRSNFEIVKTRLASDPTTINLDADAVNAAFRQRQAANPKGDIRLMFQESVLDAKNQALQDLHDQPVSEPPAGEPRLGPAGTPNTPSAPGGTAVPERRNKGPLIEGGDPLGDLLSNSLALKP